MSGMRIGTIMVKELRQISRDPATLGMLLVVPLFLLLMFGFAVTLDTRHISLALLDHDKTETSRGFVESFLHSEYFDLKLSIDQGSRIDGLLDEGKVMVALVIPAGFGRDVARGKRVEVQAIADALSGRLSATSATPTANWPPSLT